MHILIFIVYLIIGTLVITLIKTIFQELTKYK